MSLPEQSNYTITTSTIVIVAGFHAFLILNDDDFVQFFSSVFLSLCSPSLRSWAYYYYYHCTAHTYISVGIVWQWRQRATFYMFPLTHKLLLRQCALRTTSCPCGWWLLHNSLTECVCVCVSRSHHVSSWSLLHSTDANTVASYLKLCLLNHFFFISPLFTFASLYLC